MHYVLVIKIFSLGYLKDVMHYCIVTTSWNLVSAYQRYDALHYYNYISKQLHMKNTLGASKVMHHATLTLQEACQR